MVVRVWASCCLVTRLCHSLGVHGLQPTRLLCPWDLPSKNAGVGCCFLLQCNCPTQGSSPHLLFGRWILYHWATQEAWGLGTQLENLNIISKVLDLPLGLRNALRGIFWAPAKQREVHKVTVPWLFTMWSKSIRLQVGKGLYFYSDISTQYLP